MRQGRRPSWLTTGDGGRDRGYSLYVAPRPGSGLGRGSCREGFTRYCTGQNPRQTQDKLQNKLRDINQNSSSTIGLHVYHVYTLEISRQKEFIPSSGGFLFMGIRGQNRTTKKERTHLCIQKRLFAQYTPSSHVEHEKSLVLCLFPPLRA